MEGIGSEGADLADGVLVETLPVDVWSRHLG